ncbi:MAG: prolipoprotein diacylglyceryl transferase [Oscillospiraceae bacterium]|nr:prolipoprotein diacylglyceryl transferase [Oscillospiraceae bacterium]
MHPYFHILGREIPAFGFMVLLGIGAGSLVVLLNCKINRIKTLDPMLAGCMAFVGVFIGAKLLKPLITLPDIIINWEKYEIMPLGEFINSTFAETVFYGGLIGGILAAYIYCRSFKVPFLKTADSLAPAIPAGHALGRIGCLLGGCCYGVEVHASHPFAIIYPERVDAFAAVAAPAGTPLLAVPVIESIGNIIIAVLVLLLGRRKKHEGQSIALYGLLYGIQRFVLEFYRGDLVRGVYQGISTSQIISIGVVVVSVVIFIMPYLKKPVFK